MVRDIVKPAVKTRHCRYVTLIEEQEPRAIGRARAFLSHTWGAPFRDLVAAASHVLSDDTVISEIMGPRFEGKWLMQLSLFPKEKNPETGEMESTFETIEEWVPPPPEEAWESEREREREEAEHDDDGE